MNEYVVEMKGIVKNFGQVQAVKHGEFTLKKGEIHSLIGENGAGKSTMMKLLYGMYPIDEGEIIVKGEPMGTITPKIAIEHGVGMVHQEFMLVNELTVLENIILGFEPKKGLTIDFDKARKEVKKYIEQYHMDVQLDKKVSQISVGEAQRVEIIKTLMRGADIIILDEPTVGLDPIQIIEIRNLVKELGKRHTVIFSSHILSEVQAICDKILIISKGKLTALGTPLELERQLRSAGEIVLTTDAEAEKARALLSALPHITQVEPAESAADGAVTVHLKTDCEDMHAVSRSIFFAFAKENQALLELSVRKASLEDVFLELTESGQTEETEADVS